MLQGDGVVRWSPTKGRHEFVAIHSGGAGISLYDSNGHASPHNFDHTLLSTHTSYPPFSTYDWSPSVPGLIAVGTKGGEVSLLRIDDSSNASIVLPLKIGRSCLTVAFNTEGLLAVGLDRVRNDQCLQVWDVNQRLSGWDSSKTGWHFSSAGGDTMEQQPAYRMEPSVPVTSARFFEDNPMLVVAGIRGTRISIHDLRDPAAAVLSFATRNTSNLAIDHANTNYFASSPLDLPHVTVWDKRVGSRSNASRVYCEAVESHTMSWGCSLKLDKAIDADKGSTIKSLRFCRDQAGLLGILSSGGELQTLQLGKEFIDEADVLAGSPELLEVKKGQVLEYSWFSEQFSKAPNQRIDTFDWVRTEDDRVQPRVVYRRYDASLGVAVTATSTESKLFDLLNFSSNHMKLDNLAMPIFEYPSDTLHIYGPVAECISSRTFRPAQNDLSQSTESIAFEHEIIIDGEDSLRKAAEAVYQKVAWQHSVLSHTLEETRIQLEKAKLSFPPGNEATISTLKSASSRVRHAQHFRNSVDVELLESFYGALSSIARRRCVSGYLFDCSKNQVIVQDDPWLQDMWVWIEGAQQAVEDDNMISGRLDLGYLGVASVWNNDLGINPSARLTHSSSDMPQTQEWEAVVKDILKRSGRADFNGVYTKKPYHRQLCLKICGWGKSPEELEQDLQRFEQRGQYTKAAIWALCEKQPQRAVEALQRGGSNLMFVALALEVQIGHSGTIPSLNTKWDIIFRDYPELFEDPYLRAIYALISTGDWKVIVREDSVPLRERAGIAIRHLPDADLTDWLLQELHTATKTGDIEGIVLAGVTEKMADILSSYVCNFGDVQTAALVMSFTVPHYFQDIRYSQWRAEYRQYLNGHKLHVRRALFDSGHAKLARLRSGKSVVKPPQRQVTLRCVHCNSALPNDLRNTNIATPDSSSGVNTPTRHSSSDNRNALLVSGMNGGICCPTCGKHLPRCAVCLQTLGLPRSDLQAATLTNSMSIASSILPPTEQDTEAQRDEVQKNFFSFCMKCPHAMHADHALQWFSRHNECPVSDCRCQCYGEESRRRKDGGVRDEFEKALAEQRNALEGNARLSMGAEEADGNAGNGVSY